MEKKKVDGMWGQQIETEKVSEGYFKAYRLAKQLVKNNRTKKGFSVDITEGEVTVLNIIEQNPGISSVDIAAFCGCTKGAIAHVTKTLFGLGLITKRRDGKNLLLYATEKSREIIEKDREAGRLQRIALQKCYDEHGITQAEVAGYCKVLDALIDFFDKKEEQV